MVNNLGDLNEISESIQELMDLITGVEGATVTQFLQSIVDRMDTLDKYIRIFKRHIPYIYTQKDTDYTDGVFEISMPVDHIIQDSVIYLLATENSIEGDNFLRICQGNSCIDYLLYRESRNGTLEKIGAGMITPNRTVFLRLIHSQTTVKKAVVINAMFEQEATFSNINVLDTVTLHEAPKVGDTTLVTKVELDELQAKLNVFKALFLVGTSNPTDALNGKPEGTIYFKVEDYEDE
jgi:hypothetical protein